MCIDHVALHTLRRIAVPAEARRRPEASKISEIQNVFDT
jgi:hypothetical protein